MPAKRQKKERDFNLCPVDNPEENIDRNEGNSEGTEEHNVARVEDAPENSKFYGNAEAYPRPSPSHPTPF